MGQLASQGQIMRGFARWAMVCVPAIVLLGFLSGRAAGSTGESRWYQALAKPDFMPPTWAFPVAWTILYILMGLALAMILNARGAKGRGLALSLFGLQLLLNLAWSPLFFGAKQVSAALLLIVVLLILAALTCWLFLRIRKAAGYMLLPYVAWISFATLLNFQIDMLNPDAETFVPPVPAAEVIL